MFEREPKLFDPILGPFKNDKEARSAQNGALPPDLSLIAKARNVEYLGTWWWHPFSMLRDIATSYQEGGADYIYALLTGYHEAPAGVTVAEGMHYNVAFPGHQIAMSRAAGEGQLRQVPGRHGLVGAECARRCRVPVVGRRSDARTRARAPAGWSMLYLAGHDRLALRRQAARIWSNIPH